MSWERVWIEVWTDMFEMRNLDGFIAKWHGIESRSYAILIVKFENARLYEEIPTISLV